MIARSHKAAAATLRLLLLLGVAAAPSTGAAAQMVMVFLPNYCNFQEVSLAPCMAAASSAGDDGNISGACCSSLNRALDAGHRCVCSLLLSNAVLASLVANLPALPLLLPLPGCFLYAPSLAACQATTIQQQTTAPPTTAASTAASTGDAARKADPPTTPVAVTPLPEKRRRAGTEKADGRRSTAGNNGTSEAAPKSVCRSNACRRRHPDKAGQGTAYALTFLTAVAVSWINGMTVA